MRERAQIWNVNTPRKELYKINIEKIIILF